MKLLGITGDPLGHSLSPVLHNWAFGETGFAGLYLAWPVPAKNLANFFLAVRTLGILGGNITIPHKVAAMNFVDKLSSVAKKIGAINTFYWRDELLCGENTDVSGFMKPIGGRNFVHALVLGAGGAARAVVAGLKELGIPKIDIANRSPAKAKILADEFGVCAIPWEERQDLNVDLIVNATSQGMQGAQADSSPYPAEAFAGRHGLVYDLVYNPLETRLLREASRAGWETQNGLRMFVEQAREAFRLWTGVEMPLAGAEELLKGILGKKRN